MKRIAIIANPQSGKDIRRITSKASVFSNEEKVNIVERMLSVFNFFKIDEIYFLKDAFGIVEKAFKKFKSPAFKITPIPIEYTFEETDTEKGARFLNGVVDIAIVIGGDGTSRAFVKGLNLENPIPIFPLSTGTNNVFPVICESTTEAIAIVSYLLLKDKCKDLLKREKILEIKYGDRLDFALIDAVFSKEQFIGAKAILHPEDIIAVFTTTSQFKNIGLSTIPAPFYPSKRSDPFGSFAILGEGKGAFVPIAPGKIEEIHIKEAGFLEENKPYRINLDRGTVALDGERKIEIFNETEFHIKLSAKGPWVLDIEKALDCAIKEQLFIK